MALEALSGGEPRCILRAGRCVVHGLSEVDAAQADRAEIVALRTRVAELEAALEQMQSIPVPRHDLAAPVFAEGPEVTEAPEFAEGPEVTEAPEFADAVEFAEAWIDGEATFEERLAARAFFHHGADDERARSWILDNG